MRWSDDSACVCMRQSSSELSRPLHILHKLFLHMRFDAEAGALWSRRAFLQAWVLGASAVSELPCTGGRTAQHAVGVVGLAVSHGQSTGRVHLDRNILRNV